ncbi:hypothetical protein EV681_0041 [Advenella incenata]|uniref:Uncharacterized protein n=1 Tax=Advenella incenata TaxID=267800 RepID=A0A4V2FTI5_9BURK|nr:hypothetical protein [Advenella incenata]RZT98265.1 hypothetical protein EV681_0041 [Advenella incenata]
MHYEDSDDEFKRNYDNYGWRSRREYLEIFAEDRENRPQRERLWKIQVKGFSEGIKMPERIVDQSKLSMLIDPSTGSFLEIMCFDDHPFRLNKIEIIHRTKTVCLHILSRWNS